jgi:hypothetical protein
MGKMATIADKIKISVKKNAKIISLTNEFQKKDISQGSCPGSWLQALHL